MRSYSTRFSLVCCAAFSITLAGCADYPSPIPRGYSSYKEVYKSAPGPKAGNIGYEYSSYKNDAVINDMRYAARDLIEKLDDKLSFGADKIYLKIHDNTAFYNSFDHLLRDELTQRGYLLANSPVNSLVVDFVAIGDLPECLVKPEDTQGDYRTMYLTLAINTVDRVPQDSVSGYYEVPAYDYAEAGDVLVELPPCAEEELEEVEQAAVSETVELVMEEAAEEPVTSESAEEEVKPEVPDLSEESAIEDPTDILSIVPELLKPKQEEAENKE